MADFHLTCQRCGAAMEMLDPAAGTPWRPDQFWVCPSCGRHFWTTYPSPPAPTGEPRKPTSDAAAAG